MVLFLVLYVCGCVCGCDCLSMQRLLNLLRYHREIFTGARYDDDDDEDMTKAWMSSKMTQRWRSGLVVGRRTCDLVVAGSRPGRDAAA